MRKTATQLIGWRKRIADDKADTRIHFVRARIRIRDLCKYGIDLDARPQSAAANLLGENLAAHVQGVADEDGSPKVPPESEEGPHE